MLRFDNTKDFDQKKEIEDLTQLAITNASSAEKLIDNLKVQRLFYDPANMLALMKLNPALGKKIIAKSKDIQEILIINEIPTQHPDLFGFMIESPETNLALAKAYSLKPSSEYNQIIQFAIGYYFLNNFTDFKSKFGDKNINASISIEIGKLYIDNLHGLAISPSKELCEGIALLFDQLSIKHLSYQSQCKSKSRGFYSERFVDSWNNGYDIMKIKIHSRLSSLFHNHELPKNTPIDIKKHQQKNCEVIKCLYGALALLDKEKSYALPNIQNITSVMINHLMKNVINEINHQNEHFSENEFVADLNENKKNYKMA